MSNKTEINKSFLSYAAGVFKVDFTAAGYKDLLEIAKAWAKNPNFYQLVVRTVTETNWGIQFLYISSTPNDKTIDDCRAELREKFGKAYYAQDVHHCYWGDEEEAKNGLRKLILVQKEFATSST